MIFLRSRNERERSPHEIESASLEIIIWTVYSLIASTDGSLSDREFGHLAGPTVLVTVANALPGGTLSVKEVCDSLHTRGSMSEHVEFSKLD